MNGYGEYVYKNGTSIQGEWIDNVRIPTLMERLGHAEAVLDQVEEFVNSVTDTYGLFSKLVDSVSDAIDKIF